jgi:hypothetical protein
MNMTDETNDERLATMNLFFRLSSRYFLIIFNFFSNILYKKIYSDIAFFSSTILWSYDRCETRILNVFLSKTFRNSWYSNEKTSLITMFDLLCFSRCFSTFFRVTKNRFTFLRLFIMLKTNASIIAMFISDKNFFSFELKIVSSLKLSLKS